MGRKPWSIILRSWDSASKAGGENDYYDDAGGAASHAGVVITMVGLPRDVEQIYLGQEFSPARRLLIDGRLKRAFWQNEPKLGLIDENGGG